jgi:hypothetical protein
MTDMLPFTVEAVSKPVYNDDGWLPLRRVTDLIPGAFLIEDAEEPTLVMPVDASAPTRASLFVENIFKLVGIELVSETVRPAEDDDQGPALLSPEAELQHQWAESVPLSPPDTVTPQRI